MPAIVSLQICCGGNAGKGTALGWPGTRVQSGPARQLALQGVWLRPERREQHSPPPASFIGSSTGAAAHRHRCALRTPSIPATGGMLLSLFLGWGWKWGPPSLLCSLAGPRMASMFGKPRVSTERPPQSPLAECNVAILGCRGAGKSGGSSAELQLLYGFSGTAGACTAPASSIGTTAASLPPCWAASL